MKLPGTFSSLAFRNFRFLWLSTAMANSGQYAFTVAASWLVYSLSQSAALVGTTVFASMIPGVLFGPLVGVLVDRFERGRLLTLSLLFNACNIGCLALLLSFGYTRPWVIIISAFLLGISFNMQITCTNSLLPHFVPDKSLFNATALQGAVQHGAGFFGSGLASPLLSLWGPVSVFYCCFLLYVGAVIQSLMIRTQSSGAARERFNAISLFRPIVQGFAYIGRTADLRSLILVVGAHCFLTMAYMSLLPGHIHGHLSAHSGVYSMLMMYIGFGAVTGTLVIASITSRQGQGRLYIFSAVASGLSLLLLALVHIPEIVYAVGILVGGTQAIFMAINLSFVLERANGKYRGRVASINFITASGCMALGNFIYGAISDSIPAHIIMSATGGGFVVLVGLLFIFSETFRMQYHRKELEEIPRPYTPSDVKTL